MRALLFGLSTIFSTAALAATWLSSLQKDLSTLDAKTGGNLGVAIRVIGDSTSLSLSGNRPWYLASTTKIPIAIALLQAVDRGEIRLEERIKVEQKHFVDGGGRLIKEKPGQDHSLDDLMSRMLRESDSTATDLLLMRVGEAKLNEVMKKIGNGQFGPITSILQVRYDAYGELHPNAAKLENTDFIDLKSFPAGDARFKAFAQKIGVPVESLRRRSLEDAFEAYYARGKNSATLDGFTALLESLHEGKLLSPTSTKKLLALLRASETGDKRIKSGLPANVAFAQKTGTQQARVCNVGIVEPTPRGKLPFAIAACVEKFDDQEEAENTLAEVGKLIAKSPLLSGAPSQSLSNP